ncbi:MAG TPA: alpha-L-fucosidase, partial [Anaerolineae bacterium]
YSVLAGEWKGQRMDYIGEWIMSRFRIPLAEYEATAARFNPQGFDADAWVQHAKKAGMRYVVYTAKHHEGFAMYHSAYDRFNIVDATPFGRDPLKELADACARADMKLGLYYSQDLDWHEPDGGCPPPGFKSNFGMSWGNDWDFPDYEVKSYARYYEKKVKPQVRELLTNYGPIGLIWFDTPVSITAQQSDELYQLVHQLQPDCLVNTRIGNGLGDYGSMGDNQVPEAKVTGAWETPATLNDTWGYKHFDNNWKSSTATLSVLAGLAEKNVNYLLNIGPQPDGRLPEPAVQVLNEVSQWMECNTEAIHGTRESPYPYGFEWGWITSRMDSFADSSRLYLILREWPQTGFALNGLRSTVRRITLLKSRLGEAGSDALTFRQALSGAVNQLVVSLTMTSGQNTLPVVVLELEGEPDIDQRLMMQQGTINLPAACARIVANSVKSPELNRCGILVNWNDALDWVEWDVLIPEAGYYSIDLTTSAVHHSRVWTGGHVVRIETSGTAIQARITADVIDTRPETRYYAQATTHCGSLYFERSGEQQLACKALAIRPYDGLGLALVGLKLTRST